MPTPEIRHAIHPEKATHYGEQTVTVESPKIVDRRSGSTFVTRREMRNAIIIGFIGYIILSAGQFWTSTKIQDKARNDLVENAVALCERGVPLRQQTNLAATSLRVVSLGTSDFLTSVSPTLRTPELRTEAFNLAGQLKLLADAQKTVPVGNCTELREQLLADR